VGTVEFSDYEQMTVADIPGIVDGAHEGKGLGHVFLRHIERTKLLVYMVDVVASVTEDRENVSPGADLASLISELELYMPGLSTRRCIVVANKMDKLPQARQAAVLAELESAMPYSSEGLFAMSAQRGGGVKEVITALRNLVDTAPAAEDDPSLPQSIVGKNGRFLAQNSEEVETALARQAQDQAEEEIEHRNYIRNLKSKRRGKIRQPGREELEEADEEYNSRDAQMVREADLARRAAARLTRGWMKHKHDK
jgi:ribosome-binding ATPase YchF (GTP1/OBG family)